MISWRGENSLHTGVSAPDQKSAAQRDGMFQDAAPLRQVLLPNCFWAHMVLKAC